MRRNIVVANWKMNLTRDQALALTEEIINLISPNNKDIDIIIAPSFIYLYKIAKICQHNNIFVAAQDCHRELEGAFTGSVSSKMITSCNVDYTPTGVKTHPDGSPVIIKMALTFKEMDMITKEHIAEGY